MKRPSTLPNVKRLTAIALGVLAVGFVLPTGASAYPYLSKPEAKREARPYANRAIPRWIREDGRATLPIEREVHSIHDAWRLRPNLVVFELYASYLDAEGWEYEVEGRLRVRETRPGHYRVRGANVEIFESSND